MRQIVKKQILCWLLCVAMLVSLLSAPLSAYAQDPEGGGPANPTLNYISTDPAGGQSGKLWIGDIGDMVFDDIAYSKTSTGGREDMVTLNAQTGEIAVGEGYTLAESGASSEAVTFRVDATYYDPADVLFVENFEGAEVGTGTGQKFSGTYGSNASGENTPGSAFKMPVVADAAKARAGSKAITQGPFGAQADNVKAPLDDAAKAYLADNDGVVTMWYYDDGSSGSAQTGFGGGVYPGAWASGNFSNMMGLYYQSTGTHGGYSNYSYRHGGTYNAGATTFATVGTWASGLVRTEGWHKFQWKLGETGTTFWMDGTRVGTTITSATVKRDTISGLFIPFNWNNQSVPFHNKHFIDSFSVVKGTATASETFQDTITLYVVQERGSLTFAFHKDSDTSGTLALGNAEEIGAIIDSCVFSTQTDITDILTLNPDTGVVTTETGYALTDAENLLAKEVVFEADVTYHFEGGSVGDSTFHGTATVYYDIDESQSEAPDLTGSGQREEIDLNADWKFGGKGVANASAADYDDLAWETVSVPHDWNAITGSGGGTHADGTYWYRKTLTLTQEQADAYNKRSAYLEFDAVGMEAHVFLNGVEVGMHKGGWTAFKISITGKLVAGDNIIAVSANNERKLNGDISPLWGDFNNASGINRDVRLVLTSQVHIDQLDHGSHGVYMVPQRTATWEADKSWQVDVTTRVANDTAYGREVTVKATVRHPTSFDDVLGLKEKGLLRFNPEDMYDASGAIVGTAVQTLSAVRGVATESKLTVAVDNPKLWDGMDSPYQYIALIEVYEGGDTSGALLDSYETMIGFRYYDAVRTDEYGYGDPRNGDGFYLNGRLYPLRGMAMHKDWPGLGRALENKYIEKDVEVLYEMGANWTRVSHYPHDRYTYELLARYGIACSAEIPLVDGVSMIGHDGEYTTSKTVGKLSPGFKQTTLDQLSDMIKQNYNTPSILGWLLQNELGGGTYGQGAGNADVKPAQSEMITALNDLAHALDPGRKTVMAMSLSHCYEYDSDWLLWNSYPGWYDTSTTGIGYFVDGYANSTVQNRLRPTGVSEYGAGVNPYHHAQYIKGETSFSPWYGTGAAFHPESYGNDRNETSLREINARPFFWATAGWIMFDFAAASRNEGGRRGINDKGLVRKERPADVENYSGDPEDLLLRKDGFYLYKANWNPQPMTYITERRYNPRLEKNITVTVYSNAAVVELWKDGELIGTMQATETVPYVNRSTIDDETASCIFKFSVALTNGENMFEAKGFEADGETPHSGDSVVWKYGDPPELNIRSDVFAVNNSSKAIMLTGSGNAEDIDTLIAPVMDVQHTYRVLTADQVSVTSGAITAGMLLEVSWGEEKRVYTFQQPYISALKSVALDGVVSDDASKTVDFKEDTLWEATDTEAHTLTIDLGKKYVLTELKIGWANTGAASKYTVQTSNDGVVWNTVADRTANIVADEVAQDELQSYGRYVRISIQAGTNPKIAEIEVYGWMVSLKPGEERIFVDETERTISIPTDIPDFHTGENINAGMDFTNVGPLLVVEGNASAAHVNYDYSLDFDTSRFVVTDTLGRKVPFVFKAFTGGTKPVGPFELSMGKPATSSSVQGKDFPAINATTEDDTRWNGHSQGISGLNEWVMVDLGAVCLLDHIKLEFPRNGVGGIGSNRSYTYEVLIGNSANGPFTQIIDRLSNTDQSGIFTFTTEVSGKTARFVRVRITGNSTGYQPGLNRLYVKGWSVPVAYYSAELAVNLDGAAYAAHGKTFTLRQSGSVIATGTGAGGTVTFSDLVTGVYDVYDGDSATGATLTIDNANGSATLNYYTVTFSSSGAAVGTQVVPSGNLIAKPSDPTGGEGAFGGWYKDDGIFEEEWDFGVDVVTATTTLYAKWGGPVSSVTLNKEATSLAVGQTETLTATVLPATAANKAVTWASSAPGIARVENGVVTALTEGTAIITVTTEDGGKTATCTVTVTPAPSIATIAPVSLAVDYGTAVTAISLPATITAVLDSGANETLPVVWGDIEGYQKNVAGDYTAQGTVTLPENGSITNPDDCKATAVVTVRSSVQSGSANAFVRIYPDNPIGTQDNIAIMEFDVTPNKNAANGSILFTAQGVTAGNSGFGNYHIQIRFGGSGNAIDAHTGSGFAAVNAMTYEVGQTYHVKIVANVANKTYDAWVTGPSDTVPVQLALNYGYRSSAVLTNGIEQMTLGAGGTAAAGDYTVSNIKLYDAVKSVTLNKDTAQLEAGQQETLTVVVLPANTAIQDVIWESSAPAVASVEDGVVTAHAAGTATITVKSAMDETKFDTCEVTVSAAPTVTAVEWTALTANGTSGTDDTTELTLTFDKEPTGLTADNITVTGATKGELSGTGTTRTLTISGITVEDGEMVTVMLTDPDGIEITPKNKTVAVNKFVPPAVTAVEWTALTANGKMGTAITTTLTFTFDKDPTALTADDITVTGAKKGALSGTGITRTLRISNIMVSTGQSITVTIADPEGFTITPSERTVAVYRIISPDNTPDETEPSTGSELTPPATVDTQTGEASATVSEKDISGALDHAVEDGRTEIVIKPEVSKETDHVSVTIPGASARVLGEKEVALKVETPAAQITIGSDGLTELGQDAKNITVSIQKQDNGSVAVTVKVDGKVADKVSGGLAVTIPAEKATGTMVVVLVNADGTETILPKAVAAGNVATVRLDGTATIKIIGNAKYFNDVPSGSWMTGAVAFTTARELFQGTAQATFSPEGNMTRAMLATVLHRLELQPQAEGENTFTDVTSGEWYTNAVTWAATAGIVNGVAENVFDATREISRAELVTMLFRYAGYLGLDRTAKADLSAYHDSGAVPTWAKEAFEWAVGTGIIAGSDTGNLLPESNATRAQVAVVMARLIELIAQ